MLLKSSLIPFWPKMSPVRRLVDHKICRTGGDSEHADAALLCGFPFKGSSSSGQVFHTKRNWLAPGRALFLILGLPG
jgi:hypothetical protein